MMSPKLWQARTTYCVCMFLTMNKSFDFRQMREEICVATIYYIFIKIISDKVLSTNWCGDFNSLG